MENGNLSYIDELGIGEPAETTETQEDPNETSGDAQNFVQESEEQPSENNAQEDTEHNEYGDLQKQIEGLEKRLADKDDYINELRELSKAKEAEGQKDGVEEVDDEDAFWENPVERYKELQNQLKIQQMQIQETVYANTVEDYWKTVNPDALKEAVATDTKFAQEFNGSKEPYKTAYEYLSAKKTQKVQSETALREQIRKELLAEMGKDKPKKETVPSIQTGSSGTKNTAPEDGFSAVFGG
jgi:hypothetical protein